MAILSKYPGLKVEVVVNNEPLREYSMIGETTDTSSTIKRYVEVQDGAEFAINISFNKPFSTRKAVGYDLLVDGIAIHSGVVERSSLRKREDVLIDDMTSIQGTRWISQKLCFKALKTCKIAAEQ